MIQWKIVEPQKPVAMIVFYSQILLQEILRSTLYNPSVTTLRQPKQINKRGLTLWPIAQHRDCDRLVGCHHRGTMRKKELDSLIPDVGGDLLRVFEPLTSWNSWWKEADGALPHHASKIVAPALQLHAFTVVC